MSGIVIDDFASAILHIAGDRLITDSENNQLTIISVLLRWSHDVLSNQRFRIVAPLDKWCFARGFVEHDALTRTLTFRASFVAFRGAGLYPELHLLRDNPGVDGAFSALRVLKEYSEI